MRHVRISDVTMKQAAATKAIALSFKEKLEIAKLLERLGASVVEVEGIENAKVDGLRIKSIASIVRESRLAVPVKLDDAENIDLVWAACKDASKVRLQVQASVSPAQMEYIYGKKADAMKASIANTVAMCKKLCDDVEFLADDAMRTDMAYLAQVIEGAIEAGATTITVCDAAGKVLPDEMTSFIAEIREAVPSLADVSLGLSCSDDLFMADASSIAGIIAGVDEVKASTYPLGTANLGKVATILDAKSDQVGAKSSVRTTELKRIGQQIAWMCEAEAVTDSVINSRDADESIVLTARDDIEAVIQCCSKLGYDLSPEDSSSVFEAFKRVAANMDVVGSRELDAIVASTALQVPATYKLESYVINSGNAIRATASIQIKKDDELLECVSMGSGPIDAAFMAIETIVGHHYELDDFQIQSVTEGQEAVGETVVKLVANEKIYSGRGISTDIVGSSVYAYINAVNKIAFEEQN